jgi:PAS domain S-box-containing protein
MGRDSVLILDIGGRIVWANRNAHDNVGLRPGGLIGQNYLEFCPPDTHADLLRLHKLKIEGKTVRFRFDLGHGKVMTVTSGPVRVEDRLYLFVVGRDAVGPPEGDEVLVGMVAGGEVLKEKRHRVDLNSILIGALKDEAAALRGRLLLAPGAPPPVLVRPWPIRMVLRRLLLHAKQSRGRFEVKTGGRGSRAWVKITLPRKVDSDTREFECCRRIAREHGGQLRFKGRVVVLSLPAA